jgi:UDP-N-acetylmuramoyl-tripeptide--D-alanyl-D-alanine ligase
MEKFGLEWFVKALKGRVHKKHPPFIVDGISTDSREISPNEAFIALKGSNFDGHSFIKDCIQKGVRTFVVSEEFLSNNPTFFDKYDVNVIKVKDTLRALNNLAEAYRRDFIPNVKVIGITGSSGKTTTKFFLAQLLSHKYKVKFSPKSFNNNIGVPLALLSVDSDIDIAIIEMGMNHKGEIKELSKIATPDVSIITNIGYAHIGNLKSTRNIALAKAEIIFGMKEKSTLFLNKNSMHNDILREKALRKNIEIKYFDVNEAKIIENKGLDGIVFEYDGINFFSQVPGVHNLENIVCALEVSTFFGIDISELVSVVKSLSTPEMRTNIYRKKFTLIDDSYNANPDSMKKAIDLLDSIKTNGKKIAILGDMLELGEFSEQLHLEVAKHLLNKDIDYVICYGDEFSKVHDFLIQSGKDKSKILTASSLTEIAEIIEYILKDGDVVLVKASRAMRLNEVSDFLKTKLREQ